MRARIKVAQCCMSSVSPILFIILSTLTGLVGAFIYPLMTYFLVDELKVEPMFIGVYMVTVTLSGLVISQFLGGLADKGTSARKLYVLANTGIICALVFYMTTDSFALVLFAGICFMSFGNASIPQMLTLSRQWANHHTVDITQFNARIRAGISFAWMMGPPLAFALLASVGFIGSFGMAIFASILGVLFVWRMIPEQPVQVKAIQGESKEPAPWSFWFLSGAVVLGSMGNNMYTSSLPLYTINELGLPSYTPGVLMGVVAGVEIPVMLVSSWLCKYFSKQTLMNVAFVCGGMFYTGIFFAESFSVLLGLQLINAVFYGLFAGLGLTLLQEQLPTRIGFTAAVYSNGFKVGVMIGASSTGLIAQFFSFQFAMLGATITTLFSLIFMVLFKLCNVKENT